jgi:hypothetical protein
MSKGARQATASIQVHSFKLGITKSPSINFGKGHQHPAQSIEFGLLRMPEFCNANYAIAIAQLYEALQRKMGLLEEYKANKGGFFTKIGGITLAVQAF